MDGIEDVGNESVEQESPLGEGLVEAEVEHKLLQFLQGPQRNMRPKT